MTIEVKKLNPTRKNIFPPKCTYCYWPSGNMSILKVTSPNTFFSSKQYFITNAPTSTIVCYIITLLRFSIKYCPFWVEWWVNRYYITAIAVILQPAQTHTAPLLRPYKGWGKRAVHCPAVLLSPSPTRCLVIFLQQHHLIGQCLVNGLLYPTPFLTHGCLRMSLETSKAENCWLGLYARDGEIVPLAFCCLVCVAKERMTACSNTPR